MVKHAMPDTITDIRVNGGSQLSGSVSTNGSKNASVGLLGASLLNKGTTTLHNISCIQDVFRLLEIMESLGVSVEWVGEKSIKITPPDSFNFESLNTEAASKAGRSTLLFLPALIHSNKNFEWPHAGG